jgi:hypothetical protein
VIIVRHLICAEQVVVDGLSNQVSIINVIESFSATEFPVVVQKAAVIGFVVREASDKPDYQGTLRIYADESLISTTDLEIHFEKQFLNRSIFNLHGLTLNGPGSFSFRLLVEGQELARTDVRVALTPVPSVAR